MRKSLKEILAEEHNDNEIDARKAEQEQMAINAINEGKSSFILLFIEPDHKQGGAIACLNTQDQRAMMGNLVELMTKMAGGPDG